MITAQVETWHPFIEEIQPLLPLHYQELALNRDKVPLDPMYELYDAMDVQGKVLVVSLRE